MQIKKAEKKIINKKHPPVLSADSLLPKTQFLSLYKIKPADFTKTGILWDDLVKIYNHYSSIKTKLQHSAKAIVEILFSMEAREIGIHSVRYRVKDSNGLIEKIIRKKLQNPKRKITLQNYRSEITDLIGIRALHIFKTDIYGIHHFVTNTFTLKDGETPIHYYREGDEEEFIKICKDIGYQQEKHKKGYRSIHYIVSTNLTKENYYAEIQVRTIFEEGWSEIDHKIRYSFKNYSATPFDDSLTSLNRIAGTADEIGSTIKKIEQKEQVIILKSATKKRKK
jgi:ppGpp synthetase/RelA/SpoT-type nucleotidyltranferase